MPKPNKVDPSYEAQHYIDARPRVERWAVCQGIGKLFFDSDLPTERLLEIRKYFKRDGVLKTEVYAPTLK